MLNDYEVNCGLRSTRETVKFFENMLDTEMKREQPRKRIIDKVSVALMKSKENLKKWEEKAAN